MKPAFLMLVLAAAVAALIIGGLAESTHQRIAQNQVDYDLKQLQRAINNPSMTLIQPDLDSPHFELWSDNHRQGFCYPLRQPRATTAPFAPGSQSIKPD